MTAQNSIKVEGVRIEGRGLERLERDVALALDYIDHLGIRVVAAEGWVVIKASGHGDTYLRPAEAIALALKLIAAAMAIERGRAAGTA